MFASLKKTIVGSVAALSIGLVLVGAPASAQPLVHGGHAGAHVGGFHGGFHGGHGGFGWGGVAALGAAALITGAIVASQEPGYNDCTGYRPVYDGYGNYLGQRPVNVCQ